jgi:hypothetical protein
MAWRLRLPITRAARRTSTAPQGDTSPMATPSRLIIEEDLSIATATAGAASACPAAELAAEAARVIRLIERLRSDQALIDRLDQDTTPDADEVTSALHRRLEAIEAILGHRQARTVKGAVFQLHVALRRATDLTGELPLADRASLATGGAMRAVERDLTRRLYAALAAIESQGDADLATLQAWYAPRNWSVLGLAEELLTDAA